MTEPIKDLPEMTEKELESKAYIIGQISIDRSGVWHVHYIGPHQVLKKKYFGNGVINDLNIRKLLDTVGSRLNKSKGIYLDKIIEVEDVKPSDPSVEPSPDSNRL